MQYMLHKLEETLKDKFSPDQKYERFYEAYAVFMGSAGSGPYAEVLRRDSESDTTNLMGLLNEASTLSQGRQLSDNYGPSGFDNIVGWVVASQIQVCHPFFFFFYFDAIVDEWHLE